MPGPIRIRIVTNEGEAVADEAVSVRAPGELGSFGVLHNHAPLVSTLVPGTLFWRRPDGQQQARVVGSGLIEVTHNQVTVLTESVRDAEEHHEGLHS